MAIVGTPTDDLVSDVEVVAGGHAGPTAGGPADVTALVADRIVREILNGIALRRRLH